jgi:hypothetical protein
MQNVGLTRSLENKAYRCGGCDDGDVHPDMSGLIMQGKSETMAQTDEEFSVPG